MVLTLKVTGTAERGLITEVASLTLYKARSSTVYSIIVRIDHQSSTHGTFKENDGKQPQGASEGNRADPRVLLYW